MPTDHHFILSSRAIAALPAAVAPVSVAAVSVALVSVALGLCPIASAQMMADDPAKPIDAQYGAPMEKVDTGEIPVSFDERAPTADEVKFFEGWKSYRAAHPVVKEDAAAENDSETERIMKHMEDDDD